MIEDDINRFLKTYLIPKDLETIMSLKDKEVYNLLYHYKTMINELCESDVIPRKERNKNILMKRLIRFYCVKKLGVKIRFRDEYHMTEDNMFVCHFP